MMHLEGGLYLGPSTRKNTVQLSERSLRLPATQGDPNGLTVCSCFHLLRKILLGIMQN